jgi:hypothetical protein
MLYRMRLAGWLDVLPYSGQEYYYVLIDVDPFDKYAFRHGTSENDSARRKAEVTTALQSDLALQSLPWDGNGDASTVPNILFWGQGHRDPICLSIGAPTSPAYFKSANVQVGRTILRESKFARSFVHALRR